MTKPTKSALDLSLSLPRLATAVEEWLNATAGQPTAFVLVLSHEGMAQYVSNAKRDDGKDLLKHLLSRWELNRADIPAHYNPDLTTTPQRLLCMMDTVLATDYMLLDDAETWAPVRESLVGKEYSVKMMPTMRRARDLPLPTVTSKEPA